MKFRKAREALILCTWVNFGSLTKCTWVNSGPIVYWTARDYQNVVGSNLVQSSWVGGRYLGENPTKRRLRRYTVRFGAIVSFRRANIDLQGVMARRRRFFFWNQIWSNSPK